MVHLLHRLYGVDAPGAQYCDERVCVCDHIFGTTRPIFTNFLCICFLWSWLGPPLAA